MNLAVNAFLEAIPDTVAVYRQRKLEAGHPPSAETELYLQAVNSRPDKLCRGTVVALRPGQRRRGLQQTIKEGNGIEQFKKNNPSRTSDGFSWEQLEQAVVKLHQLELTLDVRTR